MRRKASAHDLTSVDVVAETRPTFSTISAQSFRALGQPEGQHMTEHEVVAARMQGLGL